MIYIHEYWNDSIAIIYGTYFSLGFTQTECQSSISPKTTPVETFTPFDFFLMFLFCCILDLLILWVLRSWPLYTQCILRCTCMFSVVARDCDSCYWISAKQTIVVMSYLWYWLEIRISGHSHTNTAMFCRACIISVSTTVFFNTIVWPYFSSVSDVILKQLLIHVTYMYGTGRIENCKPTFICVWEIFARFPRASSSQIFLAVKRSLSYDCYNNTSLDKAFSQTLVIAN